MNAAALQRRFDAIAIDQLRAEVARLAVDLDETSIELYWAERSAEFWHDDFERLAEETGTRIGMTVDGHVGALRDQHNVHGGVPAALP